MSFVPFITVGCVNREGTQGEKSCPHLQRPFWLQYILLQVCPSYGRCVMLL